MDLVVVPGWISHVDRLAADPGWSTFIREFASFARVIQYDKLGTGASDPVVEVPTWRAVPTNCTLCWTPRAANVRHCSGLSQGGPISVMFAASYPERVRALIV